MKEIAKTKSKYMPKYLPPWRPQVIEFVMVYRAVEPASYKNREREIGKHWEPGAQWLYIMHEHRWVFICIYYIVISHQMRPSSSRQPSARHRCVLHRACRGEKWPRSHESPQKR